MVVSASVTWLQQSFQLCVIRELFLLLIAQTILFIIARYSMAIHAYSIYIVKNSSHDSYLDIQTLHLY